MEESSSPSGKHHEDNQQEKKTIWWMTMSIYKASQVVDTRLVSSCRTSASAGEHQQLP
jgi:hypothetical protein